MLDRKILKIIVGAVFWSGSSVLAGAAAMAVPGGAPAAATASTVVAAPATGAVDVSAMPVVMADMEEALAIVEIESAENAGARKVAVAQEPPRSE